MDTLALNADSLGVTEYTDFPFTQFVNVAGKTYGLTDNGLYELSGDDDAGTPIEASIKHGIMDLGIDGDKRALRVMLESKQNDPLTVSVYTERNGEITKVAYTSIPTGGTQFTQLARGVRGSGVSVEVANVEGGELTITGMDMIVVPIVR